jgi:precorrin-2 dehydrogenase/sirohydrochlorin ferrochelatase|tara:strand:- start:335 stop:892 length:558 start_codon:yes stop_codon:yes gene_type:complete
MLPIVFDVRSGVVLLVGEGELVLRRLELLDAAGASVRVYSSAPCKELTALAGQRLVGDRPDDDDLKAAQLVFGAGLPHAEGEDLASRARLSGAMVNIEDVKPLCDFHVPSMVRRGDLTMTISTGGKSPGLARRLRRHLELLFGPEWAGHLDQIGEMRHAWRAEGLPLDEVSRKTDSFIDQQGWLS